MRTQIAAMGRAGAEIAEALLYAGAAGVCRDDLRVVLIGAEKEEAERLVSLAQDYTRVRSHLAGGDAPGFLPAMEITLWPEENVRKSLNDQAASSRDKLLCNALFTREQAFLSPVHALDASGPVAAMTWASLLEGASCEALRTLLEEHTVLVGSLCEPVCSAGVAALGRWMEQGGGTKPDASLLLPVGQGQETALCRQMLGSGVLEERLGSVCLTGLPEDCRGAGDSSGLCAWLAAMGAARLCEGATRAFEKVAQSSERTAQSCNGTEGTFVWSVPCDVAQWRNEAGEAFDFLPRFDALLKAACLMAGTFGPQLRTALSAPNRLLDRMTPWYNAHFSAVHAMDAAQRQALLDDAEALMRFMAAYGVWMEQVNEGFPPIIRQYGALREAQAEAAAHYAHVLDTAGQIAWLKFEVERSGLAQERFVHRHDMTDSEAEATLRQIEDLQEKLAQQLKEQRDLDSLAGVRMTRMTLRGLLPDAEKEYQELEQQAQEGRKRVNRAAEIATVEELPRVDAARVRLDRMERHTALLKGRYDRIREDLAYYNRKAQGKLPEKVVAETACTYLYSPELLETLQRMWKSRGSDIKTVGQRLYQLWPWRGATVRKTADWVAERNGDSADCLGSFLCGLLRASGREANA